MFEIAIALISVVGTLLVIVVTPFGKLLEHRLSNRTLLFSLDRYSFEDNLIVHVRPENRAAHKKRSIGLFVDGRLYSNVASPKIVDGTPTWEVDLFKHGVTSPALFNEGNLNLRFYFDAEFLSEPIPISASPAALFLAAIKIDRPNTVNNPATAEANDTLTLIRGLTNFSSVELIGREVVLDLPLSLDSSSVEIREAYDGREISFSQLNAVTLFSKRNTSIIATPRYAWVLEFVQCRGLSLVGITVGHSDVGYCQGGVIQLKHCQNILIDDCTLFGCGTIGLSLISCEKVQIKNSRIHNNSYQISNILDCKTILFENCEFYENSEYSLLTFSGGVKDIMFSKCSFHDNIASRYFIDVSPGILLSKGTIIFHSCSFTNNTFHSLTNNENVEFVDCLINGEAA